MARVFETFVALRYVRDRSARREGRGFVRFVVSVGIGGVALGVAALLLALSIVHGFSREITQKIVGFGSDIQIESQTDAPLQDVESLESQLMETDGVTNVRRVLESFVLMRRSADDIDGVVLTGVNRLPGFLADNLVAGSADISDGSSLVVGRALAVAQGLDIGHRVTLFSIADGPSRANLAKRPRVRQYRVTGIYETSLAQYDETLVYANFASVAGLFSADANTATRLEVAVDDSHDHAALSNLLQDRYGFPIIVRPVEQVYRSLFAWVQLQESIIPVVIGFIVLVAIFNIGGILLMLVMEKTRSLGILVSMGAERKSIRSLVLTVAGLIGIAGIILGEAVALGLALLQQRFGLIPLPADAYYIDTAPIALHAGDFAVVAIATFVLCVMFAYVPARLAARLDPIRIIRFD